jgi:hypothetical protein
VPLKYGATVTLRGALSCRGLEALRTVAGATEGEGFRASVRQVLRPTLRPADSVVRENLGAHKGSGRREAIEPGGATLLYLPSSPALSPIEKWGSKLKTALRAVGARPRRRLARAIPQALATIRETDTRAWFAHCGYRLN